MPPLAAALNPPSSHLSLTRSASPPLLLDRSASRAQRDRRRAAGGAQEADQAGAPLPAAQQDHPFDGGVARAMPQLKRLLLDHNELTPAPDLSQCPKMYQLELQDNKITSIPSDYDKLKSLQRLDVRPPRAIAAPCASQQGRHLPLQVADGFSRQGWLLLRGPQDRRQDLRGRPQEDQPAQPASDRHHRDGLLGQPAAEGVHRRSPLRGAHLRQRRPPWPTRSASTPKMASSASRLPLRTCVSPTT